MLWWLCNYVWLCRDVVEVCWATDLGLLQGSLKTSNDKYHKWRTTIYKPNNSLINSSADRPQWQVQKQKSRCALHTWNKSSSWVGSYKIARQRGQGYTLYWSKPVTWNIVPIHLSAVLGGSSPIFFWNESFSDLSLHSHQTSNAKANMFSAAQCSRGSHVCSTLLKLEHITLLNECKFVKNMEMVGVVGMAQSS